MLSLMFIIGSMTIFVVTAKKLFNNSTVVKSISNFSYVRDPKITLKMYENLKMELAMTMLSKRLVHLMFIRLQSLQMQQ